MFLSWGSNQGRLNLGVTSSVGADRSSSCCRWSIYSRTIIRHKTSAGASLISRRDKTPDQGWQVGWPHRRHLAGWQHDAAPAEKL